MLHPVLLLAGVLGCQVLASDRLPKGQNYEVVIPQKLHTQHKRDTESKHPDVVHYRLHIEGEPLVMQLEKTEGLVCENYTETTYLEDGTPVTTRAEIQDHCYYQGHVKNDKESMVAISTCNGISGVIHTRGRRFLIEPLKLTDTEEHAVFEPQDDTPKTCGVTNTTWLEEKVTKSSRSRSNIEFVKYNRSTALLKQRLYEIVNYVNLVYKVLTTFVTLTGIEIWDKQDLIEMTSDSSALLSRFSTWRKNNLIPRKPNDNAQLISDMDFNGATVGLAYMATMCSDLHSAGVIQDHSKPSTSVGATVAHEMGHNLGMSHDSSSCICNGDSCIMAASLSYKTPQEFSSCSQENFQTFCYQNMPQCMRTGVDKTEILTPPVCGNKITELGEECDCGTKEECSNPCCDAAICKLKANAKCAVGECCEDCQIKKVGAVCRPMKDDCDLTDMCDGKSAVCPSDRFRVNGYSCRNDEGYCYNGKCPTLQNQCVSLWGASSQVGEDSCFDVNRRGVNYGYCTEKDKIYSPCEPKDVKCGVLFCFGGTNSPKATVAEFSKCKAVLADFGMVENGTRCNDGMVCQSGKCVSIESAYRSTDCSAKCPEHAVCDHELKCQCEEGWAPPHCDSSSSTNIIIIVVVVLLAVAVIIGIVLLVVFRKRRAQRKQSTLPTVSGATNPTFSTQGRKKPDIHISTPEMTTRNLLQSTPPPPPPKIQKPQGSHAPPGYKAPTYSVASTKVLFEKEGIKKPTTAPPPVPVPVPVPVPSKPTPPPKAMKPPAKN
uniref:Uncharacterized protein n=1 Tax=Leptobrachium leishanense TaxID=445787 RepID=A0A8C5MY72_9ANUR